MNIRFDEFFHRYPWAYRSVKTQSRNVKARMQVENRVLNYFVFSRSWFFSVAYVLILSRIYVLVAQIKEMICQCKQYTVCCSKRIFSIFWWSTRCLCIFLLKKVVSNSKYLLIANEILIAKGYIIYFCIPILIICNKACVTRYSLMS